MELSKPRLYLCKANKEIIAELSESYNINYNPKLGNISELSFSIPTEVESQHELIINPNLDKIKYRYLIKFQDENITEWFVITNIKPEVGEVDTLQVECFSLPFELNDKLVREYKTVNEQGIETPKNLLQIATELLTDLSWKTLWTTNINVIDVDFLTKYRTVEIPSATVLDAIFTVAQKFGALIIFDTENRIVKFDKPQDVGIYRGLNFDLGKYLTGLNQSLDTSSFCTQLKIYGKDGLTINSQNITGSNYLSDYSFFMYPFEKSESGDIIFSSDYFSDDLCEALLSYNQLLEDNEDVYSNLLSQLEIYQSELTTFNNQLIVLLEELDVILDSLDIAQKNGDDTTALLIQKNNKETEINNHKNNLITPKQTQINNVSSQIIDLGNLLSTESNFSASQIEQLIKFTVTKEITNEYITNSKELLEWGKEEFVKINTPSILLELNIINFNKYLDEDCQLDKGKLNIGDIVRVKYEKFNINLSAKIIELNFDYEDSSNVSVVISNLENVNKDFDLFLQKLNKTISTSTSVDINKTKWNLAENANNEVQKILNEEWNASLRQIKAGSNENVEINGRGITLTNPDNPDEAIKLMHSVIGCTQDNFNSLGVALSARGVHAEKIVGVLLIGQNLIIDASNNEGQKIMTVNETGVKISGMALEITDGGLTKTNINSSLTNVWDLAITSVQTDIIPPTLTTLSLSAITTNSQTTGDLKISITKPTATDLAGFNIWRNTSNDSTIAILIKSLSVTHSQCPAILEYIDDTLTNNQTYYYWISAFDTQGNECVKSPTTPTNLQSLDAVSPSPPSNLIAKGGWGRIDLSWTAPTDKNIAKYKILINDVGSLDANFVGITPVYSNTTAYTDFDRNNTNTRYYRISAIDSNNNESTYIATSGSASLAGDNISPNPPTSGSITSDNDGGITITFTGSSSLDALNYRIIRYTCTSDTKTYTTNVEIAIIKHLGTNTHKYIDRNLDKNKYYWYQVYTIDNSGRVSDTALEITSVLSKAILAIDNTPPYSPVVSWTEAKIGAITIGWSVISNAVNYNIYRCGTESGTYVFIGNTSQLQFTDNSPSTSEAITYFYEVTALDKWDNESIKSIPISNTSLTPSSVGDSDAPVFKEGITSNGLTAVANNDGSVLLIWVDAYTDAGSGVGGYNIYRIEDGQELSQKILLTSIRNRNLLNFLDIEIIHNTTYKYAIDCFDNSGNKTELESDLDNWVSALAFDTIAPSPPTELLASGGLGCIYLSWTPPSDIDIEKYLIEIGNSINDFPTPAIDPVEVLSNQYTDYGRDSLNKRYYRIYSIDKAGLIKERNILGNYLAGDGFAAIPGDGIAPNTPNTPTCVSVYDGSIKIIWTHTDPSGDIAKYRIYRIRVDDPEYTDATEYGSENAGYGEAGYAESYAVSVAEVDRDTLQYTDIGLENGQYYKYSIASIAYSGLRSERTDDSDEVLATDQLAPKINLPDHNLNLTATGDLGAIRLIWTEVDELGVIYEIWRCPDGTWSDSSAVKIASIAGSKKETEIIKYGSYVDYDPPTETPTTYTYKLKAIDSWGNISGFSTNSSSAESLNNYTGLIGGETIQDIFGSISTAQETADGQIQGFFQASTNEPTIEDEGVSFGDIWIKTDIVPLDENAIFRYENEDGKSIEDETHSLAWRSTPTNAIGIVYLNAYNAQTTANDALINNSLHIEYSVDGTSWHTNFAPSTDLYMHQKIGDNGTWTGAMRIAAVDAKLLNISADGYIFTRDSSNTIINPSYIKLTANKQNTTNTVSWSASPNVTFYDASTGGNVTTTGDIVYLRSTDYGVNTNIIITSSISVDSLSDTCSIASVKYGSHAITTVVPNNNLTLPASSTGVVSNYDNSGTTVQVYEGTTALVYVTSNPIAGQFTVTSATQSPSTSITVGEYSGNGTNTLTIANHSAMSSSVDNILLTYALAVIRSDGTSSTINITQAITKSKIGSNAIMAILSNESHVFPATTIGEVSNYTGSGTIIRVYEGATELTYDGIGTSNNTWKVIGNATNITMVSIINEDNYAIIPDFSEGVANNTDISNIIYIITGTNSLGIPFTITKTQTFSKSKTGAIGTSATAYWLTTSSPAIQKSMNGIYTPSAVTVSLYSTTGTSSPALYSGRFKIDTSTDGSTYTNQYTSISNESSKAYTVPADIKTIRIRGYLTDGTTLLDEQILTIINDGGKKFTSIPTPPYNIGDLWLGGSNGDLKICIIAKALNDTYDIEADWELATKYTDDTVADSKITTFIKGHETDGIPTSESIGDFWVDTDDKNKLYRASIVGATAIDNIGDTGWKIVRDTDITTSIDLLTDISSDDKLTPSEKQALKLQWDAIMAEKPIYIAQATLYGINYVNYYNEGIENINWVNGYSEGIGYQYKTSDYLLLCAQGDNGQRTYVTESLVNLTNVNTLCVEWELSYADDSIACLEVSNTSNGNANEYVARVIKWGVNTNKTITELNVSNLNGNYYIRIHCWSGHPQDTLYIKIYNIYDKDNYLGSLNSLNKYLNNNIRLPDNTIPTILSDLTTTTDLDTINYINGSTLRSKFTDYYDKRTVLYQAINANAVHQGIDYTNGIKVDFDNGIIATKSNKLVRSIFNATLGIKIQTRPSIVSGEDDIYEWSNAVDKLYADDDGNLTLTGNLVAGSTITIGSGDSIFKADTAGIYLGNSIFADAPFRVSPSGNLTAEGAIFTDVDVSGIVRAGSLYIGDSEVNALDGTQIKSDYLKLKGLTITNGTNTTFAIDSNGNVTLAGSITWANTNKPSYTASEVGALSDTTTIDDLGGIADSQTAVFNALTNNGAIQGLFMDDGELYINASYMNTGTLTGVTINVTTDLTVGNNIYIGSSTDLDQKEIVFNEYASIYTNGDSIVVGSLANVYLYSGFGKVYVGNSAIASNEIATKGDIGTSIAVFG